MSILSIREHAFGAPKYIINRYNVDFARFKVTVHSNTIVDEAIDTELNYKEVVKRISSVDQHVLFTTGKVKDVDSTLVKGISYDIEFVGFKA